MTQQIMHGQGELLKVDTARIWAEYTKPQLQKQVLPIARTPIAEHFVPATANAGPQIKSNKPIWVKTWTVNEQFASKLTNEQIESNNLLQTDGVAYHGYIGAMSEKATQFDEKSLLLLQSGNRGIDDLYANGMMGSLQNSIINTIDYQVLFGDQITNNYAKHRQKGESDQAVLRDIMLNNDGSFIQTQNKQLEYLGRDRDVYFSRGLLTDGRFTRENVAEGTVGGTADARRLWINKKQNPNEILLDLKGIKNDILDANRGFNQNTANAKVDIYLPNDRYKILRDTLFQPEYGVDRRQILTILNQEEPNIRLLPADLLNSDFLPTAHNKGVLIAVLSNTEFGGPSFGIGGISLHRKSTQGLYNGITDIGMAITHSGGVMTPNPKSVLIREGI